MKKFLVVSVAVEIVLACIWLFSGFGSSFGPYTAKLCLWGILLTLPLLLFNVVLLNHLAERYKILEPFKFLRDQVFGPLAAQMSTLDIIVASLAAGVGEELFFRGVLLPLTGLWISSFIFGAVHFVSAPRRFAIPIVIYTLAGLYLGYLAQWSDGLFLPLVTHVLYDLAVLFWLRRSFRDKVEETTEAL